MNNVRFKAILAGGTIVTGPIMGRGGMLGAGIGGEAAAKHVALDRVRSACDRAISGRKCSPDIHEPEPGCVAMYPDYSADGDGEPVIVPLIGTRFGILESSRTERSLVNPP